MPERFELISQIGKGGMGVVWKARDLETGEIIALKLLHELYVDDEDYVARLEREVEIARRIDSPYVVKVLGYGRQDGVPYVAMEYVEGQSLRELLKAKGKLSWDDWAAAKTILRQTAEGLAAVHAAGVIHRDIKPSNILIGKDGTAKLADFGIARAGDLTRMTGSVTMLGTPAYMAPDLEVTEQSDLYALGCVLYEMLAGTPPFVSDSQQQVLMRHIREEPDLKKLPADARPMAAWLLAKDPARRAPDANAVVTALSGTTLSSQGGRSRWRVAAFIALPVLVGVAGLGIAAGLMGGSERDDVAAAGPSATSAATAAVNGGGSSTAVNSAQTGPKGAESQTSSPAQLTRPPDEGAATAPKTALPGSPGQATSPVVPTTVPNPPTNTPVVPTATRVPPAPTRLPPTATSTSPPPPPEVHVSCPPLVDAGNEITCSSNVTGRWTATNADPASGIGITFSALPRGSGNVTIAQEACNVSGCGSDGISVTVREPTPIPAPPTATPRPSLGVPALTATAISPTDIRLDWSYGGLEPDYFYFFENGEKIHDTLPGTRFTNIAGLTPGTFHCYSISAYSGGVVGPASNVACATSFNP